MYTCMPPPRCKKVGGQKILSLALLANFPPTFNHQAPPLCILCIFKAQLQVYKFAPIVVNLTTCFNSFVSWFVREQIQLNHRRKLYDICRVQIIPRAVDLTRFTVSNTPFLYTNKVRKKGSVLGPLLFILYTTPLTKVISDSSSSHKLYVDDTQLHISFSAADFSHNIAHLELTVSNVYKWMSSNFLSLNPPKTEFLVIGLPKQLENLNHPTIHLPSNYLTCWLSS